MNAMNLKQRWIWALFLLIYSGLLCFLPLVHLLGYEFAFALTLPLSLLGFSAALAARKRGLQPWRAFGWAALEASLLGLLPLLPISLNALRVRNCNFGEGLLFYLLLPLLSLWIATAWGILLSRLRRPRLIFALLFILSLLLSLGRVIFEPPVDAFHPLLGYFPGPIYDEVVAIGDRLLYSRLEDLLLALLVLSLTRPRWFPVLSVALLMAGGHWLARSHDVHRDAEHIQERLGGFTQSEHLRIWHPESWSPKQTRIMSWELEFAYEELEHFFGLRPPGRVDVYLYPSRALKKRLMGAGRTRVAKPWQRAMHIHAPKLGDGVTIHELAHIFSAEISNPPHHLSWAGLLPNMALIEGLAVAATWESGRLDPHQWSEAMERIKRAPSLKELLQPQGFYARNNRSAYTLCGSFVRFYRDTQGQEEMALAYRTGQFKELDAQLLSWRQLLEQQPLSEGALAHAQARYDRPAIFRKICAHEIAALRRASKEASQRGEPERALEILAELLGHTPRDLRARLSSIALLSRLERGDEARGIAQKLSEDKRAGAVYRHRAQVWLADLGVLAGRKEQAREAYQRLLSAAFQRKIQRNLAVKLAALDQGEAGSLTLELLLGRPSKSPDRFKAILNAAPGWGIAHYLRGRKLIRQQSYPEAIKALREALKLGLPHPALILEARWSIARAYLYAEEYPKAAEEYEALSRGEGLERGEQFRLARWARRARSFARRVQL